MSFKESWLWFFIFTLSIALSANCSNDESSPDGGTSDAGEIEKDAGSEDASEKQETDGEQTCTDDCSCESDEVCDFVCAEECTVECLGGNCTAECPEGGCELDADFQAKAEYSCSGGGCLADCDNNSTCELDCSGGGCEMECDGESTCSLSCSESGAPCTLTCAAGSRGLCEGDNCTADNCEATCEPDPTIQPEIDPKNFTTEIDNPLLPLPIGAQWIYKGVDEVITVTVTDESKKVMGVDVVVVRDTVTDPDTGELIEDTRDWYAQDSEGNVWYFGEDTAEYEDGAVVSTAGAWEGGVDGAQPGIIMQASPEVGQVYYQEYQACEAEDQGEVVAVDVSLTGQPTGDYDGCVQIRDFTALEPAADEIKTFCPGVGVVLVTEVVTGELPVETLDSVTFP